MSKLSRGLLKRSAEGTPDIRRECGEVIDGELPNVSDANLAFSRPPEALSNPSNPTRATDRLREVRYTMMRADLNDHVQVEPVTEQ